MTVESYVKSEHFKTLKRNLQELSLHLFDILEKKGICFKINTGEANNRFVFWSDEALDRNRDRDFLTIFTRRNGLLLWSKLFGLGWKSVEAINLQKEIFNKSQIDKDLIEFITKAYKSICVRDSIF